MSKCARLACARQGSSVLCGACKEIPYCSDACLIRDWSVHMPHCSIGAETARFSASRRLGLFPDRGDDIRVQQKSASPAPSFSTLEELLQGSHTQKSTASTVFAEQLKLVSERMEKSTMKLEEAVKEALTRNGVSGAETLVNQLRQASRGLQKNLFPIDFEDGTTIPSGTRETALENYLDASQDVQQEVLVALTSADNVDSWETEKEQAFIDYMADHIIEYVGRSVKAVVESTPQPIGGLSTGEVTDEEYDKEKKRLERLQAEADILMQRVDTMVSSQYKQDFEEARKIRKQGFSNSQHVPTRMVQKVRQRLRGAEADVQFSVWRYMLGMATVGLLGGSLYVGSRYLSYDSIKSALFGEDAKGVVKDLNDEFAAQATATLGERAAEAILTEAGMYETNQLTLEKQELLTKRFFAAAETARAGSTGTDAIYGLLSSDSATIVASKKLVADDPSKFAFVTGFENVAFTSGDTPGVGIPWSQLSSSGVRQSLPQVWGQNVKSNIGIIEASKEFVKQFADLDAGLGSSTRKNVEKFFEIADQNIEKLNELWSWNTDEKELKKIMSEFWTGYNTSRTTKGDKTLSRALLAFTRSTYNVAIGSGYHEDRLFDSLRALRVDVPVAAITSAAVGETIEDALSTIDTRSAIFYTPTLADRLATYHPLSRALMGWTSRQGFAGRMLGVRAVQLLAGGTLETLNTFEGLIGSMIAPIYSLFKTSTTLSTIFGYITSIAFNYALSYALLGTADIVTNLGLRGVSSLASLTLTVLEAMTTTLMGLFGMSEESVAGARQAFGSTMDSVKVFTKYTQQGIFMTHFLSQVLQLSSLLYALYGAAISAFISANIEAVSAMTVVFALVTGIVLWARGASMAAYIGDAFSKRPLLHVAGVISIAVLIQFFATRQKGVTGINLWETMTRQFQGKDNGITPTPSAIDAVGDAHASVWNATSLGLETGELERLAKQLPEGVDIASIVRNTKGTVGYWRTVLDRTAADARSTTYEGTRQFFELI